MCVVVSMVGQRSDWGRRSAAATLLLLSTALRDRATGTWVVQSSAYPTEVEMRGAVPPLFTVTVCGEQCF